MISSNRTTSVLCSGSSPAPATLLCIQEGCNSYGAMCGDDNCQCMSLHTDHDIQMVAGITKKLMVEPTLPHSYVGMEKNINEFIDRCIADMQTLKRMHN